MPPTTEPPVTQRLRRWLGREGASLPGIKILDLGQAGRQAVANRRMRAGSLVLHLPPSLLMDVTSARRSPTGQALLARHPETSDTALLAAHLLDVDRHGGRWSPYCQTLPGALPEHPTLFSPTQLRELQGSYALRVIERHRARQVREYRRLSESQAVGQAFSAQDHALAWAKVLTRRFDIRLDGVKTMAMIPFADMPDHAWQPNLQWSSESSRGFFLTAARDLDAGTPLTIRYWKQCNGLTLATYGFSMEKNPYNVAELRFSESPAAEPTSSELVGVSRDGKRVFLIPAQADDTRTVEMLNYLVRLTGDQGRALELLKTACEQRLDEFATTLDEDRQLLQQPELPLWKRFVVRVRYDEKIILHGLRALTLQQVDAAVGDRLTV